MNDLLLLSKSHASERALSWRDAGGLPACTGGSLTRC